MKKFLRVVKHWKILPRSVVDVPSLEWFAAVIFKTLIEYRSLLSIKVYCDYHDFLSQCLFEHILKVVLCFRLARGFKLWIAVHWAKHTNVESFGLCREGTRGTLSWKTVIILLSKSKPQKTLQVYITIWIFLIK